MWMWAPTIRCSTPSRTTSKRWGGNGLVTEPDPDCCELLRRTRTGTVVEMACSSPENAGRQLLLTAQGRIPPSKTARLPWAPWCAPLSLCSATRLTTFLNRVACSPALICFPSTSRATRAGGAVGIQFCALKPALVLIEDHVTHLQKHSPAKRNNYRLLMRTGLNSWYVPAEPSLQFFCRCQV